MSLRVSSGCGGIIVITAVAAAALSVDGTLNIQAQNTTTTTTSPQASQNQTAADPQQIKNNSNQAIQALDSGNNTKAL
jgi:hypothetical protein